MPNQSSKELVKDLFQYKELPRAPFIPWISAYAATLEQKPVRNLFSDAGLLSRAAVNAHKLFGHDAIVNIFDTSLEAEACGCKLDWSKKDEPPVVAGHPLAEGATVSDIDTAEIETKGRLPVVLEATKRLKLIRGKDTAIIAVITGPLTLSGHLKGDNFKEELAADADSQSAVINLAGGIIQKLARTYCELGVDVIAIAEPLLGELPAGLTGSAVGPLRTVWNVTRFYGVNSLLVSRGCSEEHIEPALNLSADGISPGGDIAPQKLKEAAQARNCVYGAGIPVSALLDSPESARKAALDCLSVKGRGFFLTTEWDVPGAVKVENMHEVTKALKGE